MDKFSTLKEILDAHVASVPWNLLPELILIEIFKFMTDEDVLLIRLVCPRWRDFVAKKFLMITADSLFCSRKLSFMVSFLNFVFF